MNLLESSKVQVVADYVTLRSTFSKPVEGFA